MVALTGTGIPAAPIVSLPSTSVVFGNQTLGTTSAAQTVTIRNTGTAVLSIQGVALAGANAGDFSIVNSSTCTNGASVAANGTCTIQLAFTPTGLGSRSATVGITDNAADSPEAIGLSGTTTPTPLVSVTPSNVTFTGQYVGTSGLPQSVTVTNNGDAPLHIASVSVSPVDFGTLNACGSSVAVGTSCAIGVFFDPTASGAKTGSLTVTDDAPGSPQTVSLNGTGQDFSVAPSSSSTSTVNRGQTANYTVSVAPGGGFNQTVALSCSGAPSQSTCSLASGSVVLNGSNPASVAVTVTTAGPSASLLQPLGLPRGGRGLALWLALSGLPGLVLLANLNRSCRKRQRRLLSGLAILCVLSIGIIWSACGGGRSTTGTTGNPGTPAGTYNLTVTGTFTSGSTTLTHNTKLTLVVQ